jgi:hypothetical protein
MRYYPQWNDCTKCGESSRDWYLMRNFIETTKVTTILNGFAAVFLLADGKWHKKMLCITFIVTTT